MINMKNKAFTLIELLVVIAIISLLSSIVFASIVNARQKAVNSSQKSESKEVKTSLELYRLDNNSLPSFASSEEKGVLHKEGTPEYNQVMQELVDGQYISRIPESSSGTAYGYLVSDDSRSAIFYSDQYENTGSSDVCVSIGDDDFGINSDSCGDIIVNNNSETTFCGEPPYLTDYPDPPHINNQSYDKGNLIIAYQLAATDPEEENVEFSFESYQSLIGDAPTECSLSTSGLASCVFDSYGPINKAGINFNYLTQGCLNVPGYIELEFQIQD
jgi:type II secretion system protein G